MDYSYSWTLQAAILPLLATLVALICGLLILAFPPPRRYRKLSIVLLALPVAFAFTRHTAIAPSWMLSDTFGRFLYIWLAHMSYEVTILEYEPAGEVIKEKVEKGWAIRLRQAYKVLFDRHHHPTPESQGSPHPDDSSKKHDLSRKKFVLYHACKAATLYLALEAWPIFQEVIPVTRHYYTPEQAYFFRRLASSPSSVNLSELYFRLEAAFDWTIMSLFLYEYYHSVFAVLFVGVLGLDNAQEWSKSLCGPLWEAWSVRRYWGKHWHNYIYHSFCEHIKIVTRGWLGCARGKTSTRILENTLVFLVSGLMHTLVRWQSEPESEVWSITYWYVGQMLPIIIEGVVQDCWRKVRQRLGLKENEKRVNALEKAIGYAWVTGWFMWSIPKYLHTRNMWIMNGYTGQHAALHESLNETMKMYAEEGLDQG